LRRKPERPRSAHREADRPDPRGRVADLRAQRIDGREHERVGDVLVQLFMEPLRVGDRRRHLAGVEIRRHRSEARLGEAVGEGRDVAVESPPRVEDDETGLGALPRFRLVEVRRPAVDGQGRLLAHDLSSGLMLAMARQSK
jgi:hypothetical protein